MMLAMKMKTVGSRFVENVNLRVLIEPRGIIRIVQLAMSIFAIAITAGFECVVTFQILCRQYEMERRYIIGYPFKMFNLRVPERCGNISSIYFKTYTVGFNIPAELYVATGALTLIFTVGVIFIYVFLHRLYSTHKWIPILDYVATGLISILWFAESGAWAQGISEILNFANIFKNIPICQVPGVCAILSFSNTALLYVSMISGFVNGVLCISSLWFVYKETSFYTHEQIKPPAYQVDEKQQAPPMQEKDTKMGA